MKFKFIALAAASVAVAALSASGARASYLTYNFASYIDNTAGEKAVISPFTISDTSGSKALTITALGTNFDSVSGNFSTSPYAYFDHGGAGIGVCQVLRGTQCAPSSDDNVTGPGSGGGPTEILSLAFGNDVRISNLLFRNDGHTPKFGSGKLVKIAVSDGMGAISSSAFTSYSLEVLTDGSLIGASLLGLDPIDLGTGKFVHIMFDNQQFYLSGAEISAVPLPASLPLFLSGVFGLGAMARRRQKKAAAQAA